MVVDHLFVDLASFDLGNVIALLATEVDHDVTDGRERSHARGHRIVHVVGQEHNPRDCSLPLLRSA